MKYAYLGRYLDRHMLIRVELMQLPAKLQHFLERLALATPGDHLRLGVPFQVEAGAVETLRKKLALDVTVGHAATFQLMNSGVLRLSRPSYSSIR